MYIFDIHKKITYALYLIYISIYTFILTYFYNLILRIDFRKRDIFVICVNVF